MAFGRRSGTPVVDPALVDPRELEQAHQELEQTRATLGQLEKSSTASSERYELMIAAAGIGLWDMDVVAHAR